LLDRRAMPSYPNLLRASGAAIAAVTLGAALASTACTGTIAIDEGVAGPGSLCGRPSPPEVTMRHLGRVELDHTLADLLHVPIGSTGALAFAADDSTTGFEVGTSVPDVLARAYLDTGEALATSATDDLGALDPILARCTATAEPTGAAADRCARDFVVHFGRLAFRRPLETDEVDEYAALFTAGQGMGGFRTGIQLVVNAMIVSPSFLYHAETVPTGASPGDVVRVSGLEMASRLSFFLWRSGPDDALLDAALAGELDDADGVDRHARAMLDDPRSSRGIHELFRQWLNLSALDTLSRNTTVYPEWTPDLRASLRGSMDAFVDDVMRPGNASLDALMTADWVYVDHDLATLLDVAPPTGTGFVRTTMPSAERAGLLTQPALMAILGKANQSDPIHRGVFVRTRLLCDVLAPPPGDVDTTPPDLAPGLTTRERFDMHRTQPRCAACHQLIDPIGFGFEHYDALGRFRATEEGHPIDATGDVLDGGDATGAFDGAPELASQLLGSERLQSCVSRQFFRFAATHIETRDDACSTRVAQNALEDAGDLRELLIAITSTESFRYRRIPTETSP
jgi:hypothetical protein